MANIIRGSGGAGEYLGNATPAQVLAGATFHSNSDAVETGVIPTAITGSPYEQSSELYMAPGKVWLKTQGGAKYFPNATWLYFDEPNLTAANVKAGVTLGSTTKITGTFTSDATATATDILNGKSAYVNGVKVNGAMVARTGDIAATGTSVNQDMFITVPAGYYNGTARVYVYDVDFVESNIKSGVNLFGKVGTYQGNGLRVKQITEGSIQTGSNSVGTVTLPGDTVWENCIVEVFSELRIASGTNNYSFNASTKVLTINSGLGNTWMYYKITEFVGGTFKSIQKGFAYVNKQNTAIAGFTNMATISPVNVSKSILIAMHGIIVADRITQVSSWRLNGTSVELAILKPSPYMAYASGCWNVLELN